MIDRDIKGTSVKLGYFYGQRGTYIRRDPQTKVYSNCGLREGSTIRREREYEIHHGILSRPPSI